MSNKQIHANRETWLEAAMAELDRVFFEGSGYDLPEKLRVSCGWPKSASGKAIGQCWDTTCSADETYEMFISPEIAEPLRVLDILLHEMIHACVGIEAGHKGPFRKMAKEFELEGKMTATFVTEGTDLWKTLSSIYTTLGTYPHAAMTKKMKLTKPNPWVRYKSVTEESYKVVANIERVQEFGAPVDPWGEQMVPNK